MKPSLGHQGSFRDTKWHFQTSKAHGDANMTLKLKDDMMKNLKMWEDVTKILKMSDAIKTSEM